jgi:hypothetical protein
LSRFFFPAEDQPARLEVSQQLALEHSSWAEHETAVYLIH